MRFIFALAGGLLAVVIITLLAAGIWNMFPDDGGYERITDINLNEVITDTDYKIEGLNCECHSEKLKFERQDTPDGLGCKASILSVRQLQELPECNLPDKIGR
ncbi:MAG: hypothetical protein HWE13_09170 [Gammaproteobacteria bacterium]|nr:hypothetical protein [Gammaproteobacteria bacterium]